LSGSSKYIVAMQDCPAIVSAMLGLDADEIALTVAWQIAIACLMAVIATSFWRQGKHMQLVIDALNNNHSMGVSEGVPELTSAGQRWTVRRKAAVVEAVRGGWVPIKEACLAKGKCFGSPNGD
jgi:hypothetical protein